MADKDLINSFQPWQDSLQASPRQNFSRCLLISGGPPEPKGPLPSLGGRYPTRSLFTIQAWHLGWDAQKMIDLQKCQGVKGQGVAPRQGQRPWGCEWPLRVPVAPREVAPGSVL